MLNRWTIRYTTHKNVDGCIGRFVSLLHADTDITHIDLDVPHIGHVEIVVHVIVLQIHPEIVVQQCRLRQQESTRALIVQVSTVKGSAVDVTRALARRCSGVSWKTHGSNFVHLIGNPGVTFGTTSKSNKFWDHVWIQFRIPNNFFGHFQTKQILGPSESNFFRTTSKSNKFWDNFQIKQILDYVVTHLN